MEICELPIVATGPGAMVEGKVTEDPEMTARSMIVGGPVIAYLRRGVGRVRTADGEVPLRPGMLLSAAAGRIDCELGADHSLVVVAMRAPDGGEAGKGAFMPPLARQLSPDDGAAWEARLTRMVALAETGRVGDADIAALKGDLERLLWLRDAPYAQDTLREVFRLVWEHAAEPLPLATIAAAVGYTPNYLSDLSREHTGRPLGKWIADIRMTRARHVLETSVIPIAEVGAACGYDDPAYFSRAFRRMHGIPPATWRAVHLDATYALAS
jgi:AraC-like DNA-binding protein